MSMWFCSYKNWHKSCG